jgi:hypothetical protein
MSHVHFIFFGLICLLLSCRKEDKPLEQFNFIKYSIDGAQNFNAKGTSIQPEIIISFSEKQDEKSLKENIKIFGNSQEIPVSINLTNNDSSVVISPEIKLEYLTEYDLVVDQNLVSVKGSRLSSRIEASFSTQVDMTDKFERMEDDDLLTLIQEKTFKYFWDFGHPVSGMARERNTSGDLVTTGGTGFGIMSVIVAIERGFITREEGLLRIEKIASFLRNKSDRFHGVFPHWLNGVTGKTIPFSQKDDGGDLVETSFLMAGLLCASEYFNLPATQENNLRQTIKEIWETVEWNWHTKGTENVLYWHWSPKYQWEMNHQIRGWNEALITYILAAASPTYPITRTVYEKGWAVSGAIKNGRIFYGINLPLGPDYGGPLFFSHYSFLGIDPRKLKDQYADYQQQLINHSLINYAYCVKNPGGYYGYSDECWGLTASDTNQGYTAHSPTNDKGVITPTAAISSLPFTPEPSMKAIRYFYYVLGDKIFLDYGFTDAFNLHRIWFANSYLAIDQGPIMVMIENHRSGLIWDYTMQNEDIKKGLDKLGFTYQ